LEWISEQRSQFASVPPLLGIVPGNKCERSLSKKTDRQDKQNTRTVLNLPPSMEEIWQRRWDEMAGLEQKWKKRSERFD